MTAPFPEPAGVRSVDGPEVCILMGVHNGAAHLREQLDSIAAQTHRNWRLVCSDDRSTDNSKSIFKQFQADHPEHNLQWIEGPAAGHARNFLSLLEHAPRDAKFYALSDQDDVWTPSKLARAVAALLRVPADIPALYATPVIVCSEALEPISQSTEFKRMPDFRNALVQTIGGGHTMVMNAAAHELTRIAAAKTEAINYHDWWLYQIISGAGGRVIYDPTPSVKYRQHDGNVLGTNLSSKGRLQRAFWVLNGKFGRWNEINLTALNASAHLLTKEAQDVLQKFQDARSAPFPRRLIALKQSGVFRQSAIGTAALYLACLLRRL